MRALPEPAGGDLCVASHGERGWCDGVEVLSCRFLRMPDRKVEELCDVVRVDVVHQLGAGSRHPQGLSGRKRLPDSGV